MNLAQIKLLIPFWDYLSGSKMKFHLLDRERFTLVIRGDVADLVIRKASTLRHAEGGWQVDWKIKNLPHHKKGALGKFKLSDEELKTAFYFYDKDKPVDEEIRNAVRELLSLENPMPFSFTQTENKRPVIPRRPTEKVRTEARIILSDYH